MSCALIRFVFPTTFLETAVLYGNQDKLYLFGLINSHQIAVNSLFYIKLIKSSLLILHIHVTFNVGYNHFCIHLQKIK